MPYFCSALNYKLFGFFCIQIDTLENMVKNPLAAQKKNTENQPIIRLVFSFCVVKHIVDFKNYPHF